MSARRMKTRAVSSGEAESCLRKAQEFHEAMIEAHRKGRWNAAALAGVHCAISAADAVLGKSVGIRSAGDSHTDAADLLRLNVKHPEAPRQAQRLIKILQQKNGVEYDSREFTSSEAADMLKDVGRLWTWAQGFFI